MTFSHFWWVKHNPESCPRPKLWADIGAGKFKIYRSILPYFKLLLAYVLFGYILPIYGLLMIFWVKFKIKDVKLSLKCFNLALFWPKMTIFRSIFVQIRHFKDNLTFFILLNRAPSNWKVLFLGSFLNKPPFFGQKVHPKTPF